MDMNKTMNKTIQQKYNLDKSYDLNYVDYRDYLEDDKIIEQLMQSGNTDELDENWLDGFTDQEYESINYILRELSETYGEIPEKDREKITEYLQEHNDSKPNTKLIKNTPSRYLYYSLGIDFGELDYSNIDKDIKNRVKIIARRLRISPTRYTEELSLMASQASCGNLVILFEDKIENFININEKPNNVIEFMSPVHICIMDRIQGSGNDVGINTKIICEFNRKNLHDDKGSPGYNYTDEICGLTKGFMKGAIIKTAQKTDKIIKTIINPKEQETNKREKEIDEKWRKTGECTFGDMNSERHKDTPYRNEYPCGNKCVKCGTFWID